MIKIIERDFPDFHFHPQKRSMTFLIKHNNNLFNDKLLTFPNLTIGGHDKPTTKLEESSPGIVTTNTIP